MRFLLLSGARSNHFSHPFHRAAFYHMTLMFNAGFPIDVLTVSESLTNCEAERDAWVMGGGNTEYLASSVDLVRSPVVIEELKDHVKSLMGIYNE